MDRRRTLRRLSCILMLALAALPAAAITPAPAAKTCDAVMKWARENRDSLPRDYRGLLAYEVGERRAIYGNFSTREMAGYWSSRFDAYAEENPQLTVVQQAAMAEARALTTPEFFEGVQQPGMPLSPLREQQLARFEERMFAAFGEKVARQLFYGFGPGAAGQSALSSTCECYALSDCYELGLGSDYCNRQVACDQVPGCGPLNNRICNGMCWIREPEGK